MMRRAILAMALVVGLTGIASALPTGPGGTIYLGQASIDGTEMFYVNLDSDWNTVGNVEGFATVLHLSDPGSGNYQLGRPEIWYHPDSGQRDMNGSYNDATVMIPAYYDMAQDPSSGGGTTGAQLLLVDSQGNVTDTLNQGFGSADSPNTAPTLRHAIYVDSGFTPEGEPDGIAVYSGSSGVWVDNGSGEYNVGIEQSLGSIRNLNYSPMDGVVNGEAVTGMAISTTYQRTSVVYKNAAGGYQSVSWGDGDSDGFTVTSTGNQIAVGDVLGTGIPVAYRVLDFRTPVAGQDMNQDGDMADAGESWDPGALGFWKPHDIMLIETEDTWASGKSKWVLVAKDSTRFRIVSIDELGYFGDYVDIDGTAITGWSDMPHGSYLSMSFAPLSTGGSSEIPEPGTLLLVGSGVLGLAGVIRRRLLS